MLYKKKSPLVKEASYISLEEKSKYSELMVLKSGAGYYIGTLYNNDDGYQEPGSRDSMGYYASYKAAKYDLDNNCWEQKYTA